MITKYWITGFKSGLGQYLYQNLSNCEPFEPRENTPSKKLKSLEQITLINCGFSRIQPFTEVNYKDFNQNILLQHKISQLPFKRTILCSSIDVYPNNKKLHNEKSIILNEDVQSIYAYQKLINEKLFLKSNSKNIILRLPMLFGPNCKKNTVTKILNRESLSLTKNSNINVIHYNSVLEFLMNYENFNSKGIYNIVSSKNSKLQSLIKNLGYDLNFGNFNYQTPLINNLRALKICPSLKKTTTQVVKEAKMANKNSI